MADYKKLVVWQKAHEVTLQADRMETSIRGGKYSALRSQIVRAAMSIPANIVEGRAQKGEREFVRFPRYAVGSASELEYHLKLASDLSIIDTTDYATLSNRLNEVQRMLRGLMNRLAVANSVS